VVILRAIVGPAQYDLESDVVELDAPTTGEWLYQFSSALARVGNRTQQFPLFTVVNGIVNSDRFGLGHVLAT
jgi:hypothetical protein